MAFLKMSVILLAVTSVAAFPLLGCSGSDKPEPIASPERVNQVVEMRKLFDKVKGNWNALSPEEQAQYTKYAGDANKAKFMWNRMAHPGPSSNP